MAEFVPPDFVVPLGIETSDFLLEPLGPLETVDYAARRVRVDTTITV